MPAMNDPEASARIGTTSINLLSELVGFATVAALSPLSFGLALTCSATSIASKLRPSTSKPSIKHHDKPARVLLSGAGSPASLALARLLQNHGHTVIGAEHETLPVLSPARFSKAFHRFYRLSTPRASDRKTTSRAVRFNRFGTLIHPSVQTAMKGPSADELYAADIAAVMEHERIDIWIPCETPTKSGPVTYKSLTRAKTAIEDASRRCICPNDDIAALSRSVVGFAEFTNALQLPIRSPTAMLVHSRDDVHRELSQSPPWIRFTLEKVQKSVELLRTPINTDLQLTERRPSQLALERRYSLETSNEMVRLSMDDKNTSFNSVARISISEQAPWLLKEDIQGPTYVSSAIVIDGRVRAFVASESYSNSQAPHPTLFRSESQAEQGWRTLPQHAPLYPALLQFTQEFASYQGHTGSIHLNITFVAIINQTETGSDTIVMPLSCNTSLHESMSLLLNDEASSKALADLYTRNARNSTSDPLVVGEKLVNGIEIEPMVTVSQSAAEGLHRGYAVLFSSLIYSLLHFVLGKWTLAELLEVWLGVLRLGLVWSDDGFDWRDPWPWWYATNIREPARNLAALGINVHNRIRRRQ